MAIDHEKTSIHAVNTAITGSISKINFVQGGVIDEITFGKYVEGGTNITHSHKSTDTLVATGSVIDGPIVYFKSKGGNATLVHYNGNLV
tara:strand:- start:775 stop:1041 length:267 start_codon:yes stop_codon:yes gene_type:complete